MVEPEVLKRLPASLEHDHDLANLQTIWLDLLIQISACTCHFNLGKSMH